MRLVHFLSLTVVMAALPACSERASHTHAGNELAPQPYALEGTEVREIRARALHRDYQLFISLPRGYTGSTRRYPVLFDTDANYAFPLIRSGGDR